MKENDSELGVCAVCGRNEAVAVIASGIAPVSGAQCQECQDQGAEAMGAVHIWVALNGGIDRCPDFAATLISYDEGQYVGWQRICSLYKEREADILAELSEDFKLIEDS